MLEVSVKIPVTNDGRIDYDGIRLNALRKDAFYFDAAEAPVDYSYFLRPSMISVEYPEGSRPRISIPKRTNSPSKKRSKQLNTSRLCRYPPNFDVSAAFDVCMCGMDQCPYVLKQKSLKKKRRVL